MFYISSWQDGWMVWGVAAGILMFFASLQAVHFFRSRGYETFLFIHIILAAVIVPAIYFHVKVQIKGIQYVYAMMAIWAFDYLARFLRIIVSGITSKADVRVVSGDILEFKIAYSRWWKYYPGSYAFIHILLPLQNSWQSHPFSLVSSPLKEDEGKVIIFARIKEGITKSMSEYILRQPSNMLRTIPVLLDGPYGDRHHLHHYNTLILVAGGIGITGVYPYAAELVKSPERKQNILFIWTTSDDSFSQWFGDYIAHLTSDERIQQHIYLTSERHEHEEQDVPTQFFSIEKGERPGKTTPSTPEIEYQLGPTSFGPANGLSRKSSVISASLSLVEHRGNTWVHERATRNHSRPDLKDLVANEISKARGSLAFVVCGPGPLNDVMRCSVADNIQSANARIDYYEEAFCW
ncbi:Fre2p [Sugiyamaella lignohabitans]|uniref:ferric-chelate reductase (NADPH) n=1 Tax=Sugiyamaella lignohabitans TaxID=796027 RepID=A0A167FWB3_9ASCO|nr:Fre2p [Sugiyamaella lignohabitans]ANB15783.1 Fre2p [Sugiyamaella lignohabitans]